MAKTSSRPKSALVKKQTVSQKTRSKSASPAKVKNKVTPKPSARGARKKAAPKRQPSGITKERLETILVVSQNGFVESEILNAAVIVEHLCLKDTGQNIIADVTAYNEGKLISQSRQTFSANSRASLEAYFLLMCQKIAGEGLIVYHHSSRIFELARDMILLSRQPFALMVSDDVSFNWLQQHFIACARARFTLNSDTRTNWRGRFVYDCAHLEADTIGPVLKACANRKRLPTPKIPSKTPKTSKRESTKAKKKSTLLVSYFMPPSETVAVHRLSYWHQKLPEIAILKGKALDVSVLTAINSYQTDDKYIVVPDIGNFGPIDSSVNELIQRAKAARVNYFAAYWASHVRKHFDANPDIKFDSVVLSGNPFFYFELGAYFKEKWGAKIILDFRDPFANNPRFVYSKAHKSLVNDLEDQYLGNADYALSVNKYCLDFLRLPNKKMGYVVANGYNERIVNKAKPIPLRKKTKKINFVYTGSFYADRNAEPFLASLNPDNHSLIHIGRQAETDAHLDSYFAMERYGLMPYADVVGYCCNMDAGIIFTSGKAFEQTTKIFDYIATGIDVVLVTDGEIHTGELENLTKGLEGVFWVKNNPKSISAFLKTYSPRRKRRKLTEQFSRLKQTEVLYDLIMN